MKYQIISREYLSLDFVEITRTEVRFIREFEIYDATLAKTSLKIVSSSLSIFFIIMSICLTFES